MYMHRPNCKDTRRNNISVHANMLAGTYGEVILATNKQTGEKVCAYIIHFEKVVRWFLLLNNSASAHTLESTQNNFQILELQSGLFGGWCFSSSVKLHNFILRTLGGLCHEAVHMAWRCSNMYFLGSFACASTYMCECECGDTAFLHTIWHSCARLYIMSKIKIRRICTLHDKCLCVCFGLSSAGVAL
jgi:hypothetical protein